MVLEKINKPNDIKKIKPAEYNALAEEIREFLISSISNTGGHLASNLGTVELTMALHLALQLPEDKIVWDVGHQAYTHKILSGRKEMFDSLRQYGGLSGFPKRRESEFDAFDTGHSSTSISAGLGLAKARDLKGEKNTIVSVIGDGAMTGGMVYEAINNAGRMKTNFIIILNDNNMSISENVGGFSKYLNGIRMASGYNQLKDGVSTTLSDIPLIGKKVQNTVSRTKSSMKQFVLDGNMMFENMGVTYIGPIDGHDVNLMVSTIRAAKKMNGSVLIHVMTTKGMGYRPAMTNPSLFHGVEPFEIITGKPKHEKTSKSYTDVFSNAICNIAENNPNVVAITAAMSDGTGLKKFSKKYPDRFFDVGIAEEHAITFAGGLAAGGVHPVVCIYSSFLQRAYDQIIHDVCLQNLPVTICVDRAGIVGSDGETHQGIFDISFLSSIPNLAVAAPKNRYELEDMLAFACSYDGPMAIRYPRGIAYRGLKELRTPIEVGKAEIIREGKSKDIAVLAVGTMVKTINDACEAMEENERPTVVNMRFVSPLDLNMIKKAASEYRCICLMEENVHTGGFCQQVESVLCELGYRGIVRHFDLPDQYIEHGCSNLLLKKYHLDSESVLEEIRKIKAGLI